MIVGKGLIATAFVEHDKADVIFFASGVSNSLETDVKNFKREEDLVRKTLQEYPNALFIYFSTCSIYDSSKVESPYVLHKLNMENIISNFSNQYLTLRVSNAVGNRGNPNLLLNFLFQSVKNGETIQVHEKATRNLIDIEDVRNITLSLIEKKSYNKIVNVAYLHEFGIGEILESIQKMTEIKPKTNLIDAGNNYHIYLDDSKSYFEEKNRTDKFEYLNEMIAKYYLYKK